MFNSSFDLEGNELEFVFGNSVIQNINYALVSLKYILNEKYFDKKIYNNRHTYYFFHIQSLLTACGCIYNVFYTYHGFNKTATKRCTELRDIFNICKSEFPLVFQKEARNTNEHFDERYDTFDYNIGDYNLLDSSTDRKVRNIIMNSPHLRSYDIESKIYSTYDRQSRRIEYNFDELSKELIEMKRRIVNNPYFISARNKN